MEVDELVLAHEDSTWLLADRIDSTGWRDSRNDRKWCNFSRWSMVVSR
jgi:hypothetical protein